MIFSDAIGVSHTELNEVKAYRKESDECAAVGVLGVSVR